MPKSLCNHKLSVMCCHHRLWESSWLWAGLQELYLSPNQFDYINSVCIGSLQIDHLKFSFPGERYNWNVWKLGRQFKEQLYWLLPMIVLAFSVQHDGCGFPRRGNEHPDSLSSAYHHPTPPDVKSQSLVNHNRPGTKRKRRPKAAFFDCSVFLPPSCRLVLSLTKKFTFNLSCYLVFGNY